MQKLMCNWNDRDDGEQDLLCQGAANLVMRIPDDMDFQWRASKANLGPGWSVGRGAGQEKRVCSGIDGRFTREQKALWSIHDKARAEEWSRTNLIKNGELNSRERRKQVKGEGQPAQKQIERRLGSKEQEVLENLEYKVRGYSGKEQI